MIAVTMTDDHRIDAPDAGEVRPAVGVRPFAHVEQQSRAADLGQKTRRPLNAETGYPANFHLILLSTASS